MSKSYYVEKRKVRFLVTGSDNNVKNARSSQLWGVVLNTDKLPEELKDYFQSVPNAQNQRYVITEN